MDCKVCVYAKECSAFSLFPDQLFELEMMQFSIIVFVININALVLLKLR